jgi:hypothetical protein
MLDGDIRGIKLTTGIDVIGKVYETKTGYDVLEALLVQIVNGPQGAAVALTPIDMFSSKAEASVGTNLELKEAALMMPPYEPIGMLEARYKEEISGIDLSASAKPGIIT